MSVWFSKETRYATVLQFYRKLGFYPVQAQFFPLPYILRDKLCEKIHEVNGIEFLLSYHKRISKRSKKSKPTQLIGTNFREDITLTCESCGVSCDGNEEGQLTFTFCTHQVPKQSRFSLQKNNKTTNICGITLCFSCNNSFNLGDTYDRCPIHHVKKEDSKDDNDSINIPIGDKCRLFVEFVTKIIKEKPQSFFSSCYEGHKGFESGNNEPSCRHCLSHNTISKFLSKHQHICHHPSSTEYTLQPFQRFSYCVNPNLPHLLTNVVHDVNSLYHIRKMKQIQKNFVSCDLSSKSVEHPLFFDNNINKPSSILQNRVFGLRGIEGFGDCGFLCIYYGIISSPIRNEIISNIIAYINEKNQNLPSIFSMQDIRKSIRSTRSSLNIVGEKKKEEDFSIAILREALFLARIDIDPAQPYKDTVTSEVLMTRLLYENESITDNHKKNAEKILKFLDEKFFDSTAKKNKKSILWQKTYQI